MTQPTLFDDERVTQEEIDHLNRMVEEVDVLRKQTRDDLRELHEGLGRIEVYVQGALPEHYACPYCKAEAGARCVTSSGRVKRDGFHTARDELARTQSGIP